MNPPSPSFKALDPPSRWSSPQWYIRAYEHDRICTGDTAHFKAFYRQPRFHAYHLVWKAGLSVPAAFLRDHALEANGARLAGEFELLALPDEWTSRLARIQRYRRGYLPRAASNRLRRNTNWETYANRPVWRNFLRGRPDLPDE